MRILLFDMWAGGHNARYFDRFTAALDGHEVVVAAPGAVRAGMAQHPHRFIALARARSAPTLGRPEESWDESVLGELELIEELVATVRPDCFVHLFADHLVDRADQLPRTVLVALLVLFPADHYPRAFGSDLTAEEHRRATALAAAAARARTLGGARVLTLDAAAALAWTSGPGAPAHWLPEPWVAGPTGGRHRSGDVLFFGAIAHRKGFHFLAEALLHRPDARLTVAGWVEQDGYESELLDHVRRLRRGGVPVRLRLGRHDEPSGLALMRRSRVAVLPYRRHFGMSRVFLEAVHCRTPVVVNDFGLLAHLVTEADVGVAVDVTDPVPLSAAIAKAREMTGDTGFLRRCERFESDYSRQRFQARLHRALGIEKDGVE